MSTRDSGSRPMRWWDIDQVVAMERELFPDDPWSSEQFWGELAHVPETRWYVVHEDDIGIDGYVGLFAVPPEGDVQTIAVATRAQGSGLGRALLGDLVDEARRRGCTQLLLEVREDNSSALGYCFLNCARGIRSVINARIASDPSGSVEFGSK